MSKKQLVTNKKILITGGAGFIGSYLVENLVHDNNVTIFDNFRRNAIQYTKFSHDVNQIEGDILDSNQLKKIIPKTDIIIHLAAIAGVSSYYNNPLKTLEVDALGTYNILKIASKENVGQVILFSSSEVYGQYASDVSEESNTVQGPATDSRWSYAVGKLVGDHFGQAFSKMTPLNVTSVRPFNVYGPRQVGEGAIQIFIKKALRNEAIEIRGSGKQIRAWCYIDDFLTAIIYMLGNKKAYNQIFNIGNPQAAINVTGLAQKIISLASSTSKIVYTKNSMTDIVKRIPDVTKAQKVFNFIPAVNLDTGLASTVNWYKENENF